MSPRPALLGELLSTSWSFFQKNITAILLGAVVFGAIFATTQHMLVGNVTQTMTQTMTGKSQDDMEDVMQRMMSGDESAVAEMEEMMEDMGIREGMTDDEVQALFVGKAAGGLFQVLPSLGAAIFALMIVGIISYLYFLILAIDGKNDMGAIFARMPSLILPLIGLWLWLVVRTFVWIPFIGPIFALVLGPRFLLAPVYLVKDGKGVFESATKSYEGTRGYWGKIVGNIIVVALLSVIIMWAVMLVAGIAGMMSVLLTLLIVSVAQQMVAAYGAIFGVQLALALMKHPVK